tara:strand:- start:3893 stop:4345 length:453 start_codon:yes stop_codon:yes gene_type:complete
VGIQIISVNNLAMFKIWSERTARYRQMLFRIAHVARRQSMFCFLSLARIAQHRYHTARRNAGRYLPVVICASRNAMVEVVGPVFKRSRSPAAVVGQPRTRSVIKGSMSHLNALEFAAPPSIVVVTNAVSDAVLERRRLVNGKLRGGSIER